MTVLITRPLAAAKRTEQTFQSAGITTWLAPVLAIIPIPATINPIAYDAIITTSANGVESFAIHTQNRDLSIFCAGAVSAAIARELGFQSISYPDIPGGKDLITLVKQSSFKRLGYIRGEVVKIDIAEELANIPGMHIDTHITYKTVPTTAWSHETVALFHAKKVTAITFYSEHSARIILDLLKSHSLLYYTSSITGLCLSDAISDIIQMNIWKNIVIGSTSDELAANLLETSVKVG